MLKIKKYLIGIIIIFCLPLFVQAGSISFGSPIRTSANTYEFSLIVSDINLNYINGKINVTNGKITKVKMASGWLNKTGTNNNFYFYHDGIKTGSYTVATIEVTMTDSSKYDISLLKHGIHKCMKETNGLLFGENGNIVDQVEYNRTCALSDDASLKSLTTSHGTLTPTFKSDTTMYYLNANKNTSTITFYPETNHPKAKIISGKSCNLKDGYNNCEIVVQAERGNTKTYKISVYKESETPFPFYDTNITDFKVYGGTLTSEFNQNIYEYNVKIDSNAEKVYFTFKTDSGKVSHTSDSCNSYADSCKLTVTFGKIKKIYNFTFIQEGVIRPGDIPDDKPSSQSPDKTSNSNTTKKPSTSNKNQTTTSNNSSGTNQKDENTETITDSTKDTEPKEDKKEEGTTSNKNEVIEENKDTITFPFTNIEISKTVYIIGLGTLIFLVGVLIGVLIKSKK